MIQTRDPKTGQMHTDYAADVIASPESYTVTQSDAVADPNGPFIGMRFDAAGTVALRNGENTATHLLNVLAGEYWPATIQRVFGTGTSLTNAQMIGFKRSV